MNWAYGVTTVPSRRNDLLPETLCSLCEAGFDAPRLFIDGDNDPKGWEREFGLETTCRYPTIRTHGNWILALSELFIREPHAERYALFQDDLITYRNLKSYLEHCEYPEKGYWNLYTFPENQRLARDHTGWYESNQLGKGAVALVFSQDAVMTLLCQPHMIGRPRNDHRGWRAVDGGIVYAFRKEAWREYVHNPSLVQHTGDASSMGNRRHEKATSFLGSDFDAMSLLDSSSVPTS